MALPYPIASTQTDAKSPIDDNLMDSIREDLDYLDGQVTGGIVAGFNWNVNGKIRRLANWKAGIDTIALNSAFTPLTCRASIRKSGVTGSIKFDIRRITTPKTPIIEIANQYDAITQSIANIAPALATQSISRAAAQISTQSITQVKSAININSIIQVPGTNLWRLNLASAVDSDWKVGDPITVASATSGGNNGNFLIKEVNQSGYTDIVVENASGVAQTSAAGTVTLKLFSYNYINPVSAEFADDETILFSSHTSGASNGFFFIYKTNQLGNNIWVYQLSGVTQGSAAGTADTNRWRYVLGSSPNLTDFVVGDFAKFSGHTNSANDGNYTILAINEIGFDVKITNLLGVAQASPGGQLDTNKWVYALPTDPSSGLSVGDYVKMSGHTNALNNGIFIVNRVNRSGFNIIVENVFGVAQAGVAGLVETSKKVIKFSSDQSAIYTTLSLIEIVGCPDSTYNRTDQKAQWPVVQVNRGGGSNYNVVIDAGFASEQPNPAGYIWTEMKSIFNTKPQIDAVVTSVEADGYISDSFSDFVSGVIPSDTPLGLFIESMTMTGSPRDLSVHL